MNRRSLAVALSLLCLLAVTCGGKKTIVGSWEDDEKNGEALRFEANGKFSGSLANRYTGSTTPQAVTGTYFVAGDQVSIHINRQYGGTEEVSCKFQLLPEGDLALTYVT